MPQVFSNSMVAHVWAQQSQSEGRSHNGQFYFSGPYLYSYGQHYVAGLFAADGGPVFINSTGYSVTTGRHLSYAWRAVNYSDAWGIPDLTSIARELRRAGGDRADTADRAALLRYLSANWQSFPAESEAAAWIYRKAGKRGTWAAFRARLERAKAKADREAAMRSRKHAIARGRELAGQSWRAFRERAAREADSYIFRGLCEYAGELREARLATPKAHKRVRAILWQREQSARALLRRAQANGEGYGNRNPGPHVKARAELAKLRQFLAGRVGYVPGYDGPPEGPGRLRAALELENGAGLRTLSNRLLAVLSASPLRLPPAMRARFESLQTWADGLATVREGEETQRRAIREARQAVLSGLSTFNRERRELARLIALETAAPVPDPVTGGYYAGPGARAIARRADSVLSRLPEACPWRAERGLQLSPALADRAARIAARALEIAPAIEAAADQYRTEAERIEAARREAERIEAARIAAMSPAERREAWQAGELETRHVRALETVSGPLLRAIAPQIDGCRVTGGTLETSQGATVPLRHAFRVFQFVSLCRAQSKAWTPGAWGPRCIRVGHFTLDRVDSSGDFKAGCHAIKWPEIEALAVRLGVADCLADLPEVTAELEGTAA